MWQAVPTTQRIAILHRLADLLDEHRAEACAINALDNGTPISIIDSGTYTASWVRYYAGWIDKLTGDVAPVYAADHLDLVLHEPYGVVAVIPPWNGPMMGMGQKAAPALAAGNTVVGEAAGDRAVRRGPVRRARTRCRAAAGALNVVPGGAATGAALVRHPGDRQDLLHRRDRHRPPGDGRRVRVAHPLAFELGGKSANIVFPDADLDLACADRRLWPARSCSSGQGCALPTRLYVHADVYDDVVARVVAHVESAVVGDPLDPTVTMGPVVTEQACARILGVIDRARDEGAGTLLTGGSRLGGALAAGYYIAPTVFGDVDQASDLARNEIFGPVLSILRFRDEDDVVASRTTRRTASPRTCTRATSRAHTGWRVRSTSAASRVNAVPGARSHRAVRRREAERLRT